MYYWDEIKMAGIIEEHDGGDDWSVTAPCGCTWYVYVAGYNGISGSNYEPCYKHNPENGFDQHPIERLYNLYGGTLKEKENN